MLAFLLLLPALTGTSVWAASGLDIGASFELRRHRGHDKLHNPFKSQYLHRNCVEFDWVRLTACSFLSRQADFG
jgi:hypothetical protein